VTIALLPAREGAAAGVQTGVRLQTPRRRRGSRRTTVAGSGVRELLRWPAVPPMFVLHDQDGNGLEIVQAA
jgi:hypothetical protein